MSYLKIENNLIKEAPYTLVKGTKRIIGYNQLSNEEMLIQDGYSYFPKQSFEYELKNGQIIEREIQENPQIISETPTVPEEKTTFTKLQIRRAMRALNIEDQLDYILSRDGKFQKDWNDALEIDLNDPMIESAILEGWLSQETINKIKNYLNNI